MNNFSTFGYDGFSRNVSIVETTAGSVTSTKQFVWCNDSMRSERACEERDGTGTLTKKFFGRGQINNITKYFYTMDHLASTKEMTDNSGVIQAQYASDLYGRVSKISEAIPSDFVYGGFYSHSRSGLNLATFRAYNASMGRWISRDPLGEEAGINVFDYAHNSPLTLVDSFGLDGQGTAGGAGQGGTYAGGYGGVGITGGAGFQPGPSAATQTGAAGGGQVQHYTYPDAQLNTKCNLKNTNAQPTSNPPRGLQATPLLGDWPSTSTSTSASGQGNNVNGSGVGLDVGGIVLPKTGK